MWSQLLITIDKNIERYTKNNNTRNIQIIQYKQFESQNIFGRVKIIFWGRSPQYPPCLRAYNREYTARDIICLLLSNNFDYANTYFCCFKCLNPVILLFYKTV